ncbi:MAG: hypothetical protein CFE44_13640 [Burkholderiales bacterium PBB4]|nr:MAG: hypothetical protein CFE44_13640 [Burkholderiales bacterium PBB4]
MSDPHAATVPATLEAGDAPAPQLRSLPILFTGSGSEYFRIWIVNLTLILVTCGLYFPWAKVRRLRYFYGNTLVGGEPLGFHGNAFKMFKGFVIVALFFIAYSVAGKVSATAGFIAFLVISALWPALFKSSLQFRMANTSWRGLRFGFGGTMRDAYVACLPLFLPSILILGLFLASPELQHPVPGKMPGAGWMWALGGVFLLSAIISPWLLWNLKRYQHSHYRLGTVTTQFDAKPRAFFWVTAKVMGFTALISVLTFAAIALAMGLIKVSGIANGLPSKSPLVLFMIGVVAFGAFFLAFTLIKPYAISRTQNLVWNATGQAELRFVSALRFAPLLWMTLKNWILMVLTLGLYWPFASVAMARLRLQAVHIETTVANDNWVAGTPSGTRDTTGEAAGDFFGFDIGL